MEYETIFNQIQEAENPTELKDALVLLIDKKIKDGSIPDTEDRGILARFRARILTNL